MSYETDLEWAQWHQATADQWATSADDYTDSGVQDIVDGWYESGASQLYSADHQYDVADDHAQTAADYLASADSWSSYSDPVATTDYSASSYSSGLDYDAGVSDDASL